MCCKTVLGGLDGLLKDCGTHVIISAAVKELQGICRGIVALLSPIPNDCGSKLQHIQAIVKNKDTSGYLFILKNCIMQDKHFRAQYKEYNQVAVAEETMLPKMSALMEALVSYSAETPAETIAAKAEEVIEQLTLFRSSLRSGATDGLEQAIVHSLRLLSGQDSQVSMTSLVDCGKKYLAVPKNQSLQNTVIDGALGEVQKLVQEAKSLDKKIASERAQQMVKNVVQQFESRDNKQAKWVELYEAILACQQGEELEATAVAEGKTLLVRNLPRVARCFGDALLVAGGLGGSQVSQEEVAEAKAILPQAASCIRQLQGFMPDAEKKESCEQILQVFERARALLVAKEPLDTLGVAEFVQQDFPDTVKSVGFLQVITEWEAMPEVLTANYAIMVFKALAPVMDSCKKQQTALVAEVQLATSKMLEATATELKPLAGGALNGESWKAHMSDNIEWKAVLKHSEALLSSKSTVKLVERFKRFEKDRGSLHSCSSPLQPCLGCS